VPTNYPVPPAEAIEDLIAGMVASSVTVRRPRVPVELGDGPAFVAEYVSDEGALAVLCIADHRVANAVGGVMTDIPAQVINDAIEQWKLDDGCAENFREILNVLTRCFNSDDTPHLRLGDVHRLPGALPDAAEALRSRPAGRRDLQVSVESHPSGSLSLHVA
jgi:hypothetical protein